MLIVGFAVMIPPKVDPTYICFDTFFLLLIARLELLGNVVISKNFLRTRKIMVMI